MDLPERASVVIIGAGFAGAATAYHLTRAGVRDVLVLEREATAGHHASGRNAGLCRQLADDEVVTDLAIRGAEFLRRPPEGFSSGPILSQTGSILASAHPATLEQLGARAASRRLPHEWIDADHLLTRWPRLSGLPVAGALWFPTDGVIDIHALLQGFLRGSRERGARVALSVEVKRLRPGRQPSVVVVETSRGQVATSCVVNAAGAWANEVGRRADAPDAGLTSLRRHLFVTERVPAMDDGAPYVWYLDRDELYLRPADGALMISGCDGVEMEPGDARVAPGAQAELTDKLRRLTPWLADLRVARAWACLRTFAPDHRPRIGWDPTVPWLFWVAGLGGHGATASAAIGQVAAIDIQHRLAPIG